MQTYLPGAGASRPWPAARMLLGAAIAGVALGAAVSFTGTGPEPVCTASGAPTMVLPFEQADPADAEWESRVDARVEATASPGTVAVGRARFGLCHSGGGTNCVVDGDTFYVAGDKVRIAGIDAPETHPPRCAHEAELGERATERLRALLNSGGVTMTGIDRDRDRYGRMLRNVAVDGADVGQAMVGAGVAREYGSGRRGWCG